MLRRPIFIFTDPSTPSPNICHDSSRLFPSRHFRRSPRSELFLTTDAVPKPINPYSSTFWHWISWASEFSAHSFRLVWVAGDSVRSLVVIARWLSATTRSKRRGSRIGWHGYHLVGSGSTTRTTICYWGRWVVVRRRFLIGPFEFKFDRLNLNSTVWTEN
jgi:hypothetical protein